jgi:hypothetical protein
MPHIPHSYVVKKKFRDAVGFERFIMHIRRHGYRAKFGRIAGVETFLTACPVPRIVTRPLRWRGEVDSRQSGYDSSTPTTALN